MEHDGGSMARDGIRMELDGNLVEFDRTWLLIELLS